MKPAYDRYIKKLEKQEQKFLNAKEKGWLREKIGPASQKVAEKIPPELLKTLNEAFYKAFAMIFVKGSKVIEKTYDKEKIQKQHDVNNYAIEKLGPKKYLKEIDGQVRRSQRLNTALSVLEGTGLGLLGLGIPDIPLFISMLLKNIYETALAYGFDYEKEEEKIYLLLLINGAVLKGERRQIYNAKADKVAAYIQWQIPVDIKFEDLLKETANNLAEVMLLGKYIQGLPVVGVYGGWQNFSLMQEISCYARLKYKQRYLKVKS